MPRVHVSIVKKSKREGNEELLFVLCRAILNLAQKQSDGSAAKPEIKWNEIAKIWHPQPIVLHRSAQDRYR